MRIEFDFITIKYKVTRTPKQSRDNVDSFKLSFAPHFFNQPALYTYKNCVNSIFISMQYNSLSAKFFSKTLINFLMISIK